VFGRAFGRDVTALMAAIGCMAKEEIYYSEHKNLEAAFGRVTATIIAFLQLIGPDELPARFTGLRERYWGPEPGTLPDDQLSAAIVAFEVAFPEYNIREHEPWSSVIRDWLGEAAIARIRQRLSDPSEEQKG
ncbi:MAG: hypothetical protein WA709_11275, partial [Stellaceae bacterium]